MIWFWGLTAGVALGLEFATTTLYFGLLAVGALGGLAAAAVGAPGIIQVVVAAAITLLGVVAIRPLALKRFARVPIGARTGVDALPGAEALDPQVVSQCTKDGSSSGAKRGVRDSILISHSNPLNPIHGCVFLELMGRPR